LQAAAVSAAEEKARSAENIYGIKYAEAGYALYAANNNEL